MSLGHARRTYSAPGQFLFRTLSVNINAFVQSWLQSTVMRKWKLLLVNGWEYEGSICTAKGFLNSKRDGINASVCSGTALRNGDIWGE